MADYPAPDWTRAQIEAWKYQQFEKRFGPAIDRALEGILGGKKPRCVRKPVPCAACEKSSDAVPLAAPSRIRFSSKFKGRVFEIGDVLCHRHSIEAVKP